MDGLDALIPVINKLQDVFNTVAVSGGLSTIELPQIVVVGAQSAGKSSVLESIVGQEFLPRGSGIVTRQPLVLQLIYLPEEDNVHRNEKDGTAGLREWARFLHSDKIFDFDQVRDEIICETNRKAGSNKGIIHEAITLKIFSPKMVNLTMVDLPGMTKVPVGDQPWNIEDQIHALITKYIQNPNSIILAVASAQNDMATSEALKMAKKVDPDGSRTLAVITKLDLMDAGTDANDVLSGNVIPVKLGIVGVVNRSQKDIMDEKSMEDCLKDEQLFLQRKYPLLADHNGTRHLRTLLKSILMGHIRERLPHLKAQVSSMAVSYEKKLEAFGEPVTDKLSALYRLLDRFAKGYGYIIDGNFNADNIDVDDLELRGGAEILYAVFCRYFEDALRDVQPLSGLEPKNIVSVLRQTAGLNPALVVPDDAFRNLAKMQIKRLLPPCVHCVERVHEEMLTAIHHCGGEIEDDLRRFPRLREKISNVVAKLLKDKATACTAKVKEIIKIEASYINTRHPDFNAEDKINAFREKREKNDSAEPLDDEAWAFDPNISTREKEDCELLMELITDYFLIVRKNIQDFVPKAIVCLLIQETKTDMSAELFAKVYENGRNENLLDESPHIARQREDLSMQLQALQAASSIINEVRDISLFSYYKVAQ